MPRLPTSGSSLMTPCREESELKRVLSELCRGSIFDDAAVHQYYMTLASLIGGWLSERARLETVPVKNALLTMAKNLGEASALLSGLETGVRTDIEIAVASRVQNLMALNPTIGSLDSARAMLGSFRRDAVSISHTCMVAAADLPSLPEKRGRKTKDWYDSFTTLLLSIAEKAGFRPTLYKDREAKGEPPAGWLLDAARELETFLPAEMRSPSDVARYKRLERGKDSLGKTRRQNSSSR
jgi:hypothetical protein